MGRTYSAPAARKAICLLELMATEDKPFSVTELATRLDVTVNSVFRILKELETLQYIVKNESDSTYTLTAKLYYLGISLSSRISLKHSAQPFLTRLREETHETVLLTTFGQHYATLIVDQQISSEPIKFISTAGLEYASYSSAMGKAMLAFKSLLAAEIMSRDFTPVLASHNLRELEDICDHVGLLHKGGMLLSKDLEDMKFYIHKVQCVLTDRKQEEELKKELDILKIDHQGSLVLFTARGTRSEIMAKIQEKNPLFSEVLPLTLEEIFISETEVAGYEIQNIFF